MKKALFIIAQQEFRDEELKIPKQILEASGTKVMVASITTDQARGMLGAKVKPDLAIRNVNPNDFDVLVLLVV
jgi:protease I